VRVITIAVSQRKLDVLQQIKVVACYPFHGAGRRRFDLDEGLYSALFELFSAFRETFAEFFAMTVGRDGASMPEEEVLGCVIISNCVRPAKTSLTMQYAASTGYPRRNPRGAKVAR
jgi:hypothetical protein